MLDVTDVERAVLFACCSALEFRRGGNRAEAKWWRDEAGRMLRCQAIQAAGLRPRLTAQDAADMRRLALEGVPHSEIGAAFLVPKSSVTYIVGGRGYQAA